MHYPTHMVRNTQQRETLKKVIETAHRPLSIPEIHELATQKWPRLGIATVYREVKRLSDESLLKRVDIPGENAPRYEIAHGHHHHHHHFKCDVCNKVFDIETCGLPIEKLLPAGFTHQAHDITIFGSCKDCH